MNGPPESSEPTTAFDLFCEVVDRNPTERESHLAHLFADHPHLADEVESLLRAHDRSMTTFLVEPALASASNAATLAAASAGDLSGRVLGRYRLLEQIGSGGMGTVYLAERAGSEFEQRIAVKVIRGAAATGGIIERFRRERQLLANLSHPNITHLIDGDTIEFDDGSLLPYLVMEYVDGVPIDEYCDAKRMPIRARIELFRDVCAAVHHAHQNLIVHRDLKPSNILVTSDGVVKLLDFGIAKLVDDAAAGSSVSADVTRTIERRLTPAYAAPEQVRHEPITTATDIYALGVILYELISGVRPYEFDDPSIRAIEHAICDRAPLRPSTALSSKTAAIVAERRATHVDRLRRELRGDLEHILMTALRKEPERRYQSVQQFSEDLRRYVEREPISARPDTWSYRAGKFVRRNRPAVAAASLAVMALVVAAAVSLSMAASEHRSRLDAQRQARIAEAVSGFLINDLLSAADPRVTTDPDVRLQHVVRTAAGRIDGVFPDEPLVEASVRATIGAVQRSLGDFDLAEPHLARALELRERHLGSDHADTFDSRSDMVLLRLNQGRYAEAEQMCRQLIEQAAHSLGHEDERTLAYRANLAHVIDMSGRIEEAAELNEEILAVRRRLLGDDHPDTNTSAANLARNRMQQGDFEAALEMYELVLARLTRTKGEEHPDVFQVMDNIAQVLTQMSRFDESEAMHWHILAARERLLGAEHWETLMSCNNLGLVLFYQDRHEEAAPLLERAVQGFQERLGPDHLNTLAAQNNLALAYRSLDRYGEAEPLMRETLAARRRTLGDQHPEVIISLINLGDLCTRLEQYDEAAGYLYEAVMRGREAVGDDHWLVGVALTRYGTCLLRQENLPAAEEALRKSVEILSATIGESHERTVLAVTTLAEVREALGRSDAAQALPPMQEDAPPVGTGGGQ